MTTRVGATRRCASAVLAAGAAGALAACVPGRQGPATQRNLAGTVVYGLTRGTPAQIQVIEQAAATVQQRHPEIRISGEHLFGTQAVTLDARRAAGQLPDIWGLPSYLQLPWAYDGTLRALDDLVKQDRLFKLDEFSDGPLNAFRLGNRLWGIPSEPNPVMLFYNRTHFEKNGIPAPTNEWTTDQFLDLARRATRGLDGETPVWGYDYSRRWSLFMGWLGMWGTGLVTADRTRFAMDQADAIAALEWDVDLIYRHRVGPPPQGAALDQLGTNIPGADFAQGTCALTLIGIVQAPRYRQGVGDRFVWDVVAPPRGPKGRGSTLSADGWLMKRDTTVPAAAWELMKAFVGEEYQTAQMRVSSVFPSLKKLVPQYAALSGVRNTEAITLTQDRLGMPFPITPSITKWTGEILAPALTEVWQRKKSPRDAMTQVAPQINAILAEDARRPLP